MTIFDVIIVGAGASGLFCAASFSQNTNGLILEQSHKPGKKLLLTGGGHCNLTHSGDIKDFLLKYGSNGKALRSTLYQYSNIALMNYFETHQIPLTVDNDGKVFPSSRQSQEVIDLLCRESRKKGFEFKYDTPVTDIFLSPSMPACENIPIYTVQCGKTQFQTKRLVIASGGCSYPTTGSNGSLFPILAKLGLKIVPLRPALAPIYVQNYPFTNLSGISFTDIEMTLQHRHKTYKASGDLLLTHHCFSGPMILNHSRYARPGDTLSLNYVPAYSSSELEKTIKQAILGSSKQIARILKKITEAYQLPIRFLDHLCQRCNIDPNAKCATLSGDQISLLCDHLTQDQFSISGVGGYQAAMVTAGGVALEMINRKTMETVLFPNLYIIGEAMDVDGDTGGYNLQFAFSSGYAAAKTICNSVR